MAILFLLPTIHERPTGGNVYNRDLIEALRNQERVDTPEEGTIYIVSVSGTKYYEQGEFAYTQFGMTNVSTYQVLDIKIDGNRLEYSAFDVDGQQRDTFVIQK